MKNIIKDRKTLTLGLCLILICIFTLTVAYSALSAVLTIQGNARVSAANWDIYLNNPRVTAGSATTNVPVIKTSSTLEFETTLNMPGDFYEFTVDVVNDGSIDAMINSIVKTPTLTAVQAKYLKYELQYQNGQSIIEKQTLKKGTTTPIKVRIEYRKDLVASDLPTGQVVLDLAITLEYIQSDGSGSEIPNNGELIIPTAEGDINVPGTVVTIGTEQFYTIGTDGDNVKLLAMYNLYVGGDYDGTTLTPYGSEATGLQDSTMIGSVTDVSLRRGVVQFSNIDKEYSTSLIKEYVDNYYNYFVNRGVNISSARLITSSELSTLGCDIGEWFCSYAEEWVYSTSYWTQSEGMIDALYTVSATGAYGKTAYYYNSDTYGVRPVIIISKDYF